MRNTLLMVTSPKLLGNKIFAHNGYTIYFIVPLQRYSKIIHKFQRIFTPNSEEANISIFIETKKLRQRFDGNRLLLENVCEHEEFVSFRKDGVRKDNENKVGNVRTNFNQWYS